MSCLVLSCHKPRVYGVGRSETVAKQPGQTFNPPFGARSGGGGGVGGIGKSKVDDIKKKKGVGAGMAPQQFTSPKIQHPYLPLFNNICESLLISSPCPSLLPSVPPPQVCKSGAHSKFPGGERNTFLAPPPGPHILERWSQGWGQGGGWRGKGWIAMRIR